MVYSSTPTSTLGGSSTSKQRNKLYITKGLIYFLEIYLPPGSSGLLHVQIFHSGYQLLPATPGETFFGDNVIFRYDDLYPVNADPFYLDIYHYNEDTAFDHIFKVHVGLVSKLTYQARFLPTLQAEAFEKVYEKILKEQEERQLLGSWGGFTTIGAPEE